MKILSILFSFLVPFSLVHSYEIVGIGSPCVDLIYSVDDDFLTTTRLNKGDGQYAPERRGSQREGKPRHS